MKETEKLLKELKNHAKSTEVTVLVNENKPTEFEGVHSYCFTNGKLLMGNWETIEPQLDQQKEKISYYDVLCYSRFSSWPLADLRQYHARIEPGAIIRDQVEIEDNAVILMGAVINVGAKIGQETMIDMNAVIGARAQIGPRCHIGAGAVIAGVLEPASANPVIIEEGVLIGANAVVLEGVHIKAHSVIAAGAVVIDDIEENCVAAGLPAKVIKRKDRKTEGKTAIQSILREI